MQHRRLFFLVPWLAWFCSTPAQTPTGPVKIMCIGDSITAGKGYNWRYHLWKTLTASGYAVDLVGDCPAHPYLGDFDRDHEGYGGQTSDQVAKNSAPGIARNKPDIALIHLGTNDYTMQKQAATEVSGEIGGIIDHLRQANPDVTIFLAKIAFVAEDYAAAMEKLAAERNSAASSVQTVDLRTGWLFEPGNDTTDYVHPNLNGVLKISERLFAVLEPELRRRGLQPQPQPAVIPVEPPNLALGKPATADLPTPGYKARKAVDGDWKTLWAAPDAKPPHWLQVDLEAPHDLSGTGIVWDSAGAAYGYRIETSADGQTWNTAVDHTQKPTAISVALVPQKDAFTVSGVRYVRLTVTSVPNAPWTKYPASVREFCITGRTPPAAR